MGPTSSWAFCRRVLAIIGDRMPKPKHSVSPWDLETINLEWDPIALKEAPDVENLPSKDYATFLSYTVKYHLGSLYEIIDHDKFHQHLHEFYDNPPEVAREHRYWFAQFLFVLAFGEAFSKTESNEAVPGLSYASRALSLIPSLVPIDKSSLSAVEALCLAALYLQAVDLRLMAFQLVSKPFQKTFRKLTRVDWTSAEDIRHRGVAQTHAARGGGRTTFSSVQHDILDSIYH